MDTITLDIASLRRKFSISAEGLATACAITADLRDIFEAAGAQAMLHSMRTVRPDVAIIRDEKGGQMNGVPAYDCG